MVKEIICLTDGQPILVDDEDHKVSKGMTHNVLIDAIPEANPTYFLAAFPAVKITLTETCHDMGMRAYFQWKGYSQGLNRNTTSRTSPRFGSFRPTIPI